VAYHNGTAWPSAYPSFIEARAAVFRFTDLAVKQALAFFEPIKTHLCEGGIGTIAEMKDGNFPHRPRGCYAYAVSVAEALRVYMLLKYHKTFHHHHEHETSVAGGNHIEEGFSA
jgi:glycogen debranching enzyme